MEKIKCEISVADRALTAGGAMGEFLMRIRLRQAGFDVNQDIRRVDMFDGRVIYEQDRRAADKGGEDE